MSHVASRMLLAVLIVSSWMVGMTGEAAAQSDGSGDEAFVLCQDNQDAQLDVVLLLDKSGSIKTAAPEADRFAAVERFVGMLHRVSAETDRDVHLNVVLFDTETDDLGWRSVGSLDDVARISDDVKEKWSDKESTGDTDQIVAFSKAFDLLEARDGSCRVTVMFTDGVIDTGSSGSGLQDDIDRADAEACTDTTLGGGGPSLRKRAEELHTNEFVLLLEPKTKSSNFSDSEFKERLSYTMTLFTSITGDDTPPVIPDPEGNGNAFDPRSADPEVPGLQCAPKNSQTGLVLSAAEASQLEAYFLKLGAELGPSEPGVKGCPQPIGDGTEPLPHGSLIDHLQIISFNGGDTILGTDHFEIRKPDGEVVPSSDALRVLDASAVELQFSVTNPAALPGGWVLQTVDKSDGGSGYCVEVTAREDLAAQITVDPNPVHVTENDQEQVLQVKFDPEIDDYEFSFDLNGERYTTTNSTVTVKLSPDMSASSVDISNGVIKALETDLFPVVPVDVKGDVEVWDRSPSALPVAKCDDDTVTVATGEVPESSTVQSPTGCDVKPGADSDGQQSYVRIQSTDDHDPSDRTQITFYKSDGEPITSDWMPFSSPQDIAVRIDGLPNETVDYVGGYTIQVAYGPSAESASMPADSPSEAHVSLRLNLQARSNSFFASLLTAAVAVLAALLSLLLLWVFNRLTAQLPKAGDFFYYETGDPFAGRSAIGNGLDPKKLGAARGGRGLIQFGEVAVRLVHPPLWRPLADSIGVIEAPGAAAADPTGSREGTIPVGFASLVIGYRVPGLEEVRYVIVVPKLGAKAGIDEVRSILNDRVRLDRVEGRLPDMPDGGDTTDDGADFEPEGPKPPGSPTRNGKGPGSGRGGPKPSGSGNQDNMDKRSNGPTLPGGSGPRLPG